MGDRSPKDREKKKKQTDRKIEDASRVRQEKQHKPNPGDQRDGESIRKAG